MPTPFRMDIGDEVKAAARSISPALWHEPYRLGNGPLHFATGDYWPDKLRAEAARWRKLADAAEVVAEAMVERPWVDPGPPCGICGESYPHHHDDEVVEQDHLGLGLRKDW